MAGAKKGITEQLVTEDAVLSTPLLKTAFSPTVIFTPGTGQLSVTGNNDGNVVDVARNAAGQILVNGTGGSGATVANTSVIQVFGLGGNDNLSLNESNGALPRANLF